MKEDIITGSIRYNQHKLEGEGRIKLYKTINYFNKIKFRINHSLLNYLQNSGQFLLSKLDSETLFNLQISLRIANLFKDIPFYLNTHADWRGRIYTHSFYISYQGNETASALLQFWDGLPLNNIGLNYFYAYGASHYDSKINKKALKERIDWVISEKVNILKMSPDFILKAESPILFSAFCLDMQNLENNKNTPIHSPVFIDATCSGIQHISAMIADSELGGKVNLTFKDKPEDIYEYLVEPINEAINDYGRKNKDYESLTDIFLNRSILKQPIMTQNYNVSLFGMKEQLYSRLKTETIISENPGNLGLDKENKKFIILAKNKEGTKDIQLTVRDLFKISMIIKEVIFKIFPVLRTVYNYFIAIAHLMEILNLPVQWITPTGAIITQNYNKRKKSKVQLFIHNKTKVNIMQEPSEEIDHKKQIDGIIPNVIHSLDSSHISKLINESAENMPYPIITVHDCFGTHANYIDILFFRLKEEFVSLYLDSDFLKRFHKRLIQYIKDNRFEIMEENNKQYVIFYDENQKTDKLLIPEPPKKKDLNMKGILNSKYMFN